jgi:MHS family shikimate/dehydroshikimate transporter-like MFS transporter
VFEQLKSNNSVSRKPFFDILFNYPKETLIAIGIKVTEVSWSYLVTVFLVAYATTQLGMPKPMLLEAISIAAFINLFSIPFFGWVSDKIGRKPLFYIGGLFTIAMAFPLFAIVNTGASFAVTSVIIAGMVFGNAMMFSGLAAYLAELFEPQVRYTGLSFSNQVAAAIGGGLAPTIAGILTAYFGGTVGVSVMMIVFATITIICTYLSKPKY